MQYTGIGHRGGVFHLRGITVQEHIYTKEKAAHVAGNEYQFWTGSPNQAKYTAVTDRVPFHSQFFNDVIVSDSVNMWHVITASSV